jgi:hypothetical protein
MAPMITGPINGYYQGRVREVDAKAPNCSAATRGVIEIGDKTLLYAYSPQLIYVASVQPDGTVHAEAGGTTRVQRDDTGLQDELRLRQTQGFLTAYRTAAEVKFRQTS